MASIAGENLTVYYGHVPALIDVDIQFESGRFVVIIGSNGAGKSTLIKTLGGALFLFGGRLRTGSVRLNGDNITHIPVHKLIHRGLSFVTDQRNLFSTLSVEDNMRLSLTTIGKTSGIDAAVAHIYNLFPLLKARRRQKAGTLSGGEQRLVAIVRALVQKPQLVFLDEPSVGLSDHYQELVFNKLQEVNKNEGTTVVVVEQNLDRVFSFADVIVEFGTREIKQVIYPNIAG